MGHHRLFRLGALELIANIAFLNVISYFMRHSWPEQCVFCLSDACFRLKMTDVDALQHLSSHSSWYKEAFTFENQSILSNQFITIGPVISYCHGHFAFSVWKSLLYKPKKHLQRLIRVYFFPYLLKPSLSYREIILVINCLQVLQKYIMVKLSVQSDMQEIRSASAYVVHIGALDSMSALTISVPRLNSSSKLNFCRRNSIF